MGLGASIGDCEVKNVQSLTGLRQDNASTSTTTPVVQFHPEPATVTLLDNNDSPFHSVFGDPTLHIHYLAPPATVSRNGTSLSWTPSPDTGVSQYVVSYKDANGFIVRVAIAPSFVACCSPVTLTAAEAASGFIIVRSAKVVTSGNGSYWGLSAGRMTP